MDLKKTGGRSVLQNAEEIFRHMSAAIAIMNREFEIVWCNDGVKESYERFAKKDFLKRHTSAETRKRLLEELQQNGSAELPFSDSHGAGELILHMECVKDLQEPWYIVQFQGASAPSSVRSSLATFERNYRTNLNEMFSAIRLLKTRVSSKNNAVAYLDVVENGAMSLYRNIHVLSDYLLLKEGLWYHQVLSVELGAFLQSYLRVIGPVVAEQGGILHSEIATDTAAVRIDGVLFERALSHLISNGLRYGGQEAEVTVGMKLCGEEAEVYVQDNGVGLSKDVASYLKRADFEGAFEQAAIGANGMGLSIVKKAIERNNGRLTVETQQGEGAVFRMRFPLCEPEIIGENRLSQDQVGFHDTDSCFSSNRLILWDSRPQYEQI